MGQKGEMAGSCSTQNAHVTSGRHVGGVEEWLHTFLMSEVVELNAQSHAPATLTKIPVE